jgi:hypothetical protein
MAMRALFAGAGIGSLLTYFLDPRLGARRRALVRDQLMHARRKAADAIDATAKDLSNRAEGFLAEARSRLEGEEPSDEVVFARVREKLGHYVSRPRAIEVDVSGRRVRLTGLVLASEHSRLLRAVRAVRGVADVEDHLEVHETADVLALQGGAPRTGERFALMQTSWSPTTRLVASLAGLVLVTSAARRASLLRAPVTAGGLVAFGRALTNRPLKDAAHSAIRRISEFAESGRSAAKSGRDTMDETATAGC